MHLPTLITDLAVILLTGGIVTVVFKKIKQPLVLGYIVAGFLIGPYMPFFFTVADQSAISTWSEIGIIILMFGLGLEFNLHKLIKVGGTGLITALTEVGGMLILGYSVGQLMGWGTMDSIFLGGMLSMSSTTIIIKAFDELNVRQTRWAQLVFGTLVIEDIAGIFMMIILSTVSVSQNVSGSELALQLGMLVLYLAIWLILGIYLLPTLLKKATPLMSDETLLITSLGICFGMVLLADALGFSSALGAFLAGSLLAGTVYAERVEHLTSGVKDLFGSVFFISVGMMLDPAMVGKYFVPILIITAVTIVGKLFCSSLGVLLAGQPLHNAIYCGCSLAQIGEFAFIIASLGMSLGVIADYIYPIIISVSVITTLTTPFFIKGADKIYILVTKLLPKTLTEKLDRYTDEEQVGKDSDWLLYLKRYVKITLLYGVILLGIAIIGRYALLPLLLKMPFGDIPCKVICLVIIYLLMALFVRPMLDTHSPQYMALWMRRRSFRLPLLGLTGLRVVFILVIAFLPLEAVGVHSAWLLLLIAAAMFALSRSGWLRSTYLNMETQFLANLNERQLQEYAAENHTDNTEWVDQRLHVVSLPCPKLDVGCNLIETAWGRLYGVNVIRILRGDRVINMPAGDTVLQENDIVYLIGENINLHSFRTGKNLEKQENVPTLREFIAAQKNTQDDLYSYVMPIGKDSALAGCTIRDSGLREGYDCMILGLQRQSMPILAPDVNMSLQSNDLVWLLGSRDMADKLITN